MSDQFHQQQLNQYRDREAEWYAKRMTITTKAGMLRQYQLEEQARGYKIQTLEFKSPAYILKNFIYKATQKPKRSLSGLRRMQGRSVLLAFVGGIAYVAQSIFSSATDVVEIALGKLMPPPQARRMALATVCGAMLIAATATAQVGQSIITQTASSASSDALYKVTVSRVSRASHTTTAISSLHQKKLARAMHSTL